MKFLAPAAYGTSAVTSAEGEACRVDNGSVRGHNRIARRRCRTKSIDNVVRLRRVGKLELCGLKLSLKGLNLVLRDGVDNPLHSGGLVLNHIPEAVVHGVLKDVGLCRHIVVDFALALLQVTAAVRHLGAKSIESVTKLCTDVLNSALDSLSGQCRVNVASGRKALTSGGIESTSAISAEAAAKTVTAPAANQQEENQPPAVAISKTIIASISASSSGNVS